MKYSIVICIFGLFIYQAAFAEPFSFSKLWKPITEKSTPKSKRNTMTDIPTITDIPDSRKIKSETAMNYIHRALSHMNVICLSEQKSEQATLQLFKKQLSKTRDALEDTLQKPIKNKDYNYVVMVMDMIDENVLLLKPILKNNKLTLQEKQEEILMNFSSHYASYYGKEIVHNYEFWAESFIKNIKCINPNDPLKKIYTEYNKEEEIKKAK